MKHRKIVGAVGAAAVIAMVPSLGGNSAVAAGDDTTYGASFPYTRYEAERGQLDRAHVVSLDESQPVNKMLDSTAIEAGEQSYVELEGQDSSVSFTAEVPGNAIDLRFTLPDHTAGSVDIRVNGETAATFNLSSESAYQYVQKSKVYDEEWQKDPGNGPAHARFLFDEVHGLLNRQVNPGDRISVVRTGSEGHAYGIDFVELEQALPEIQRPDNSVSITDDDLTVTEEKAPGVWETRKVYARPNDGKDDSDAFLAALRRASDENKTLYIPRGTFEFDRQLAIHHSPNDNHQLTIQGAGIWYTIGPAVALFLNIPAMTFKSETSTCRLISSPVITKGRTTRDSRELPRIHGLKTSGSNISSAVSGWVTMSTRKTCSTRSTCWSSTPVFAITSPMA